MSDQHQVCPQRHLQRTDCRLRGPPCVATDGKWLLIPFEAPLRGQLPGQVPKPSRGATAAPPELLGEGRDVFYFRCNVHLSGMFVVRVGGSGPLRLSHPHCSPLPHPGAGRLTLGLYPHHVFGPRKPSFPPLAWCQSPSLLAPFLQGPSGTLHRDPSEHFSGHTCVNVVIACGSASSGQGPPRLYPPPDCTPRPDGGHSRQEAQPYVPWQSEGATLTPQTGETGFVRTTGLVQKGHVGLPLSRCVWVRGRAVRDLLSHCS